jgi:hypothetical protein
MDISNCLKTKTHMKNGITLLTLIAFALNFTACKEDEPPKSKVGFAVAETEIKESDG